MIIDGNAIAEELYASLARRRASLARPPVLGILAADGDSVIDSFVRIKRRAAERLDIAMERVDIPAAASTEEVISSVRALAARTDGLIVQLPLPGQIDTDAVLGEIPREKDVDAINPTVEEHLVHAPVALAVAQILRRGGIEIAGKRAVVVGAGRLVGAPSAALLRSLGARVSVLTLEEGSMEDLKDADIVVCGAGVPSMIRPEHLKEGVALVDAGTSEQGGVIRGDADPSCAKKAALFTPVPGGVGPVAVAMIFKNLLDLANN